MCRLPSVVPCEQFGRPFGVRAVDPDLRLVNLRQKSADPVPDQRVVLRDKGLNPLAFE
jgi:hypothetical protein